SALLGRRALSLWPLGSLSRRPRRLRSRALNLPRSVLRVHPDAEHQLSPGRHTPGSRESSILLNGPFFWRIFRMSSKAWPSRLMRLDHMKTFEHEWVFESFADH